MALLRVGSSGDDHTRCGTEWNALLADVVRARTSWRSDPSLVRIDPRYFTLAKCSIGTILSFSLCQTSEGPHIPRGVLYLGGGAVVFVDGVVGEVEAKRDAESAVWVRCREG